jgi:hypothetical protein
MYGRLAKQVRHGFPLAVAVADDLCKRVAGTLIAAVIVPGVGMISVDETRLVAAITGMYILMQDVENLGTVDDRLQSGIHCFFSLVFVVNFGLFDVALRVAGLSTD